MCMIYYSDGTERISEYELFNRYRDFLNKYYEPVRFGDLTYAPALVLETVDTLTFAHGLNDWMDANGWVYADELEYDESMREDADSLASEQMLLSELDY